MRRNHRKIVILAACALDCALSLAGCGGPEARQNTPPVAVSGTPAITVSIFPSSAAAVVNASRVFTATVSNDTRNAGVMWTLTRNGADCSPGCGTLTDVTATSVTYNAPSSAAGPATLIATSTADASKSASATVTVLGAGAKNSALNGQYAFLYSGYDAAVVGTFTADGNGKITAGNTDVAAGGQTHTSQGFAGSAYSISSDNSGAITLNTAVNSPDGNFSFTFLLALNSFSSAGVAGGGRLMESDSTDQAGAGFLLRQDPAAFSTAGIDGGYAFSLAGIALGRFTASGGSLSAGHVDLIGYNGLEPDQLFTGTYSVDSSSRGEATLNISGQPNPLGIILYVVSSEESLWMEPGSGATGTALQQSGGPFTAGSLDGTSVFGAAGSTVAGNDVAVGEVKFDGTGNVTGTNDEDYFGGWVFAAPISGTYTVNSDGLGRGAISEVQGPGLDVFYLISPNRGFVLSGNDSLEFGSFDPQTASSFSNSSFSGSYGLGTIPVFSSPNVGLASGTVSADGTGGFAGTLTTLAGTENLTGTYSVDANGRATFSPSGAPPSIVFYFISPSKAVGILQPEARDATVNIIEK